MIPILLIALTEPAPCLSSFFLVYHQLFQFFWFCFCCTTKLSTRHCSNRACMLSPPTLYKSKLKLHITHRDLEGTVRDVLPSKTDADDILARLRRCVEDVKRAVLIFNNVHVELGPLGGAHAACHLAFPSSLCVHCDDCLFTNLDCWANTGALRIGKKGSVVRCELLLLSLHTHTHVLSHTQYSACTFHIHETRLKLDEI